VGLYAYTSVQLQEAVDLLGADHNYLGHTEVIMALLVPLYKEFRSESKELLASFSTVTIETVCNYP
jgi:hypothetical protein